MGEIRAGKICNSAIATFRIVQISFLQIDFSSSVHVIFLSIFHVKKQGKLRSATCLPIFYAIDWPELIMVEQSVQRFYSSENAFEWPQPA